MKTAHYLLVLACCLGALPLTAQPFTLDEDLDPLRLTLADDPENEGVRWAAAKGTLGDEPHHLYLGGLSIFQAIEVVLIPTGGEPDLSLSIHKHNWQTAARSCAGEDCSLGFRTQGDFGVKVSGARGASYNLVVLTGPELVPTLPTPLAGADRRGRLVDPAASPAEPAAAAGDPAAMEPASGNALRGVIVVLLAAVAGLLGVLVWRRPRGRAASILILLAAGGWPASDALAQPVPMDQREVARRTRGRTANRQAEQAYGRIDRLRRAGTSLDELSDAYEALVGDCENIDNPPGMPRVPSFCFDDGDCAECFSSARRDFDETRLTFEKLRLIYSCSKTFSNKAIAFGNTVSGVHAVTGLVWTRERAEIEKSVKRLEAAYDAKYVELSQDLHEAMIAIGRCEQQYGLPDWYDRFGYVYFEFMQDRYRRTD